jgi:DNA processing protein
MNPPWLDEETRALLTLHLLPGLGPRLTAALLGRFGSATKVLSASAAELAEVPRLPRDLAERVAVALRNRDVESELELIAQHGVRLIRHEHDEFPKALCTIPDPPRLLYVRGELRAEDQQAVAIVGSRSCTPYGRRMAERLAQGLARAGYTVVSGLARGIDAVAHRAALAAGGRTLAVLAGGLARIYPPEHTDLAEEIVRSGALLSESPMQVQPLPQMFPQRNRIISGLVRGVVVVEAGDRSGALLTAHHAVEQGREVFAVPGPADSEASAGTLKLLRDGAVLVRDTRDILEALDALPSLTAGNDAEREKTTRTTIKPVSPAAPRKDHPPLTETQKKLFAVWSSEPIQQGDDLVARSGLSVSEVSQALMLLEMHGRIRRLPGNRFERLDRGE